MSEQQTFLQAIHADPDDDTVRLAYADWLEEHDDPDRAAFIRDQIRLDAQAPEDPGREALETRVNEALDRNWYAWLDPELLSRRSLVSFPESRRLKRAAGYLGKVVFRRGFPWSACPVNWKGTDTLARLLTLYPVRDVSVHLSRYPDPDVEELMRTPGLERLHCLRLLPESDYFDVTPHSISTYFTIGLTAARALVAAPRLTGLRTLILEDHRLDLDLETASVLRAAFGGRLEIT